MKASLPSTCGKSDPVETDGKLTERELLMQIVKLQTMLNSKMFEFIRDYQQRHNWGGDQHLFRDGNGYKSRIGRLFDEVNELGLALSKASSTFIGEDLYERRDESGRVLANCRTCKTETPFMKVIDAPYGMSGAYMDGTERLVCAVCNEDTIYPGDARMAKFNSVFRTK